MKKIFIPLLVFMLFVPLACGHRAKTATKTAIRRDSVKIYRIHIRTPFRHKEMLDTFTVWKQFFRLWNMPDTLNREELKDRLTLINNALTKMHHQTFPRRLDTVDVKSRLRLVMNETRQLKWTVDKNWTFPEADSLIQRWTGSYENLVRSIDRLAADTVNFEEVFRDKARRDSLINRQFEQFSRRIK